MNLTRDVAIQIALELDVPDILRLCLVNKKFNAFICNNNYFWLNKIKKDFPNTQDLQKYGESYKQIYENLSKNIEIYIEFHIVRYSFEEDEELTEISLSTTMKFDRRIPLEDIRKICRSGLYDFKQWLGLWGTFDIHIDGIETCQEVKAIELRCFDALTEKTEIVHILFDSFQDIDESDQSIFNEYFDTSMQEALVDYLKDAKL